MRAKKWLGLIHWDTVALNTTSEVNLDPVIQDKCASLPAYLPQIQKFGVILDDRPRDQSQPIFGPD